MTLTLVLSTIYQNATISHLTNEIIKRLVKWLISVKSGGIMIIMSPNLY